MKTELLASKTLRIGVIVAMVLTVAGGVIYLFQRHGDVTSSYKAIPQNGNDVFVGTATYLRELSTIIPRILQFDGAAIIQLGVIVLIATPVMRIVLSLISFLIEKDKLYVAITFIVLAVILCNMIFGLH